MESVINLHDEASEVQNESIYKRVLQYDIIWVGGGQLAVPRACDGSS